MENQQNDSDVLENLVRENLDGEVPPEGRVRAERHLTSLRRRMEGSTARSPRIQWAVAAAAAAVIIGVALGIAPWPGAPPVVFADVIRNFEQFRPYTCLTEVEQEEGPAYSYREMHISSTKRREEFHDGMVRVFDLEAMRMLELQPDKGLAVVKELINPVEPGGAGFMGLIERVKDAKPEELGRWTVYGRTAYGFRFGDELNDITVWIDPETQLPLRVETIHPSLGHTITNSEFEFDVDLPPELFGTTAPEGYVVQTIEAPVVDLSRGEPAPREPLSFRPHALTETVERNGQASEPRRIERDSVTRRRETLPNGTVRVLDLDAGRSITLDPVNKVARVKTYEPGRKDPDLFALVCTLQDRIQEDLGLSEIDDRQAQGFRAAQTGSEFTVWLDVETGLPVLVEILHVQAGRKIVFSDFDFDVEFDESLFATEVPEGYTIR